MRKHLMFIFSMSILLMLSGCAISADTTTDLVYPSFDTQINKIEPKPYRTEIEEERIDLEEPWVETQDGLHDVPGGASFISAKVSDGVRGYAIKKYAVSYNIDGERLSRVELPEEGEVVETTPTIYANGQLVKPGAEYTSSRITRYGYDCYGCNHANDRGNTSAGIQIGKNEVRQKDGTWKKGITYEGYYIVAASRALPTCTIIEVSNHSLSGNGISPGVPFKAIVLDRGGAIQGSKLDLFVGSEREPTVNMGSTYSVDVDVLQMNSRIKSNGMFNCGI
ncbi:MAG TPA: 3D domain-containing protein [Erysipelothrix sp.]|nr:3D domain-containing protein [Erysipelothrix sp.]